MVADSVRPRFGVRSGQLQRLCISIIGYDQSRGEPLRNQSRVPTQAGGGIQVVPVWPDRQVFERFLRHDGLMHSLLAQAHRLQLGQVILRQSQCRLAAFFIYRVVQNFDPAAVRVQVQSLSF